MRFPRIAPTFSTVIRYPIYHNTDYHIKVIVLIRSMIFTWNYSDKKCREICVLVRNPITCFEFANFNEAVSVCQSVSCNMMIDGLNYFKAKGAKTQAPDLRNLRVYPTKPKLLHEKL